MKLRMKKNELIEILHLYIEKKKNLDDLQKFCWEIIDFYSDAQKKYPPVEEFENEFWYAIWQIQHLADEIHEQDGTLLREVEALLRYLVHKDPLPPGSYGIRPLAKNPKRN